MWYRQASQKIMLVLRGLPGSGKSTLTNALPSGSLILSTDDFWGEDYDYDMSKVAEAHLWNQNRAIQAMKKGITPIVIDNTNISAYEMKPYVKMAQDFGYEIQFKEPNTPWKFNTEELAKRNTHNVPFDVIEQMIARWDHNPSIEDIIESKAPWEK